jgi:hypothetical protein
MRLRLGWGSVLLLVVVDTGCGSEERGIEPSGRVLSLDDSDSGIVGEGEGDDAGAVAATAAPSVELLDRDFGCKLINRANEYDPTTNQLQTRFNIRGADLGLSLAIDSYLYLFFGDTLGYRAIWSVAEADSVARIPLATVQSDLTTLCRQLDFYVTADPRSVASGEDPTVLRDFAAAFIYPPPGEPLSRFVSSAPLGQPNIPGHLEVPSGVLRDRDQTYVFYASGSVELPFTHPTRSFLARWDEPNTPGYDVVTLLDHLTNGDLGGHFIQISPVQRGDYTYLFGTGLLRRSAIYLARTRDVEDPTEYELYDAVAQRWQRAASLTQSERASIAPIAEQSGVGELSAFYVAKLGLFGLLYQRELRNGTGQIVDNRVLARFSSSPEGRWSDAVTISDMGESEFRAQHCCGATCAGDEILHCERAGLYAAYALPFISADEGVLRVPYLVSTWDPYNVVLFEAAFAVQ